MPRRRLAQKVPLPLRQVVVRALPKRTWEKLSPVVHGETGWQQRLGEWTATAATWPQARRASDVERIAVRSRGRSYLARVVGEFSAEEALHADMVALFKALERDGIPVWRVAGAPGERRVLAVPARCRPQVVRALSRSPELRHGYVGVVHKDKLKRVSPVAKIADDADEVLRYFEPLATREGQVLAGPEFGCDLEFWSEQDGQLVAPRANRYAVSLPSDQQRCVALDVKGARIKTFEPFCVSHVFDVTFPVDVVYTWVDGSDPAWIARKRQAWRNVAPGSVNDYAANNSRFLSRDELRYSMRSLEMYASWVRRIFIVTDDQVPAWLNTEHPKITVVSHRELFGDTGSLPTFNSHAIESRLHRINGLAEHYLYLNDDVFFGRPVSPELFFNGNGTSRFFLSNAHVALGLPTAQDLPVMSAGKNNRELIRDSFGRVLTHKLKHVPHPQQRSLVWEMEKCYQEDFDRTASSQFRHPQDISIPSALFPYYAWMTARATPGDLKYYYAEIAAPETGARLRKLLRERNYDVFCLNDHDNSQVDPTRQMQLILEFLGSYFPLASSFER